MQTKLDLIAAKAADDLESFVRESHDEIVAAMSKAAEEAALQEASAKFRLALTITLDLDANQQENVLSWSTRRKLSATSEIEDPAQITLLKKEEAK